MKTALFLLIILNIKATTTENNTAASIDTPWKCHSGHLIEFHQLCDGAKNCLDGSDETAQVCNSTTCLPPLRFRCVYGGCVSGNAECNGMQDCIDNSDELSPKCNNQASAIINKTLKHTSQCNDEEFECDNGECIASDRLCDGTKDCRDRSDETIHRCASFFCPKYGFRCGYGACVHSKVKCDGVANCADESDENPILCGNVLNQTINNNLTQVTVTTSAGCVLALSPQMRAFYQAQTDGKDEEIYHGTIIEEYVPIIYRCKSNYTLVGSDVNVCLNNEWTLDGLPKCEITCSAEQLIHISTSVSCEYQDIPMKCQHPIFPTTVARITCSFGYKKPERYVDVLTCRRNGEWSDSVLKCKQTCGTDLSFSNPVMNYTKVPWHVAIFSDIPRQKNCEFLLTCGGTIITAKMVLSAANCFWNEDHDCMYPKSHFRVGVGKYYRNYSATENFPIQLMNISKIHYSNDYNGYFGQYQNDVAILKLADYIIFKPYVLPICMEYNLTFAQRKTRFTGAGTVAGWGLGKSIGSGVGRVSKELKTIELPVINVARCFADTSPILHPFITTDKFCAGYSSGHGVCQGDNGAGLVFPEEKDGITVYYLRGILSVGSRRHMSCDRNVYSLFVNVHYYQYMIRSFV